MIVITLLSLLVALTYGQTVCSAQLTQTACLSISSVKCSWITAAATAKAYCTDCSTGNCCATGEQYDTLTNKCVAVSCAAASACGTGSTCVAQSIQCIRAPCPQFTCVTRTTTCAAGEEVNAAGKCVAVSCDAKSACPVGSTCVASKKVCIAAPCPQFTCTTPPPTCAAGEEADASGKCVAVSCKAANACSIDTVCTPANLQCLVAPCPQFTCEKPVTCGTGEELSRFTNKCVAVSCDAKSACPVGSTCVVSKKACLVAPCPQFTCEKPTTTCADGEEADASGKCVAVSCKSANACATGTVCKAANIQCFVAPCPQFTCEKPTIDCTTVLCAAVRCAANEIEVQSGCCKKCVAKPTCADGEEADASGKCVAVSCKSTIACPSDTVCTSNNVVCKTSPCPQFTCEKPTIDCKTVLCAAIKCTADQITVTNGCCPSCIPKPTCADGEEVNLSGKCVAVSCKSANACATGTVCKAANIQCFVAPCPQFTCEKPTTIDCSKVACDAIGCGAGSMTVPTDDGCCKKCVPIEKPVCNVACIQIACGANEMTVPTADGCCKKCVPNKIDCPSVSCPRLAARANCRVPVAVADATGKCPTKCVCTEIAKFVVTSTSAKTIDAIKALVQQAKVDGATGVTVEQSGAGFTVTITGDRESSDDESNSSQTFADAAKQQLSLVDSLNVMSATTFETNPLSESGVVAISLAVVAIVINVVSML